MRHRRLALPLALLAAGCGTVRLPFHHSEEALATLRAPPRPVLRTGEVSRLPSGLRLVAYQVDGQRDATVRLAVQAGPVYEQAGRPGTAEVANLAVWLARTGPGGARLEESLYAAGTLFEDSDTLDEVAWEVRCRPAQVPEVIGALARLLDDAAAAVDAADVAEAKARIEQAQDRLLGEPVAHLRAVQAMALAGTSYQRPLPSAEAVQAVTLEDVRAYLRATFSPRRAIFVATAGAPAHDTYRAMGQALPARLVGNAAAVIAPEPPPVQAPLAPFDPSAAEVLEVAGAQEALWLAWPLPGSRGGADLMVPVASAMLEASLRAHLARVRLGSAVRSLEAFPQVWDGAAVVAVRLEPEAKADLPALRAALVEGAARVRELPALPAWSIATVKEMAYVSASVGLVGDEARCLRVAGVPDALGRMEAQTERVLADWPAFRDRWIVPGPSAVLHVKPAAGTAAPAADDEGRPAGPGTWAVEQEVLATAAPGGAQVARLLEPPGLDRAVRERLPNGAELVVLPRPGAPYVWARLLLPGGGAAPTELGLARRSLGAARASLRSQGCTGAAPAMVFADVAWIGGLAPAHRAPWLLETLQCWDRAWPPSAADLDRSPPVRWRGPATGEALLSGAPLPRTAPPIALEGPAYLERTLRPQGATLLVVGDLAADEPFLARARSVLAGWPAREAAPPAAPLPWPRARRIAVVDYPRARTGWASVSVRLPDEVGQDLARARVATALLRRRLERTLRPAKLGVTVAAAFLRDARFLRVTVSGEVERLAPAVAEVLAQLAGLAGDGPPAVEVDVARWNVARAHAFALDTAEEALTGLTRLADDRLPADTWERFPADLAAIGPAEVRAAFQGMAVGREAIQVMGPQAAVGQALDRLGLAWEPGPPPEMPE